MSNFTDLLSTTAPNQSVKRTNETKVLIKVELIDPNPFQPRRDFGNIEELAESMRKQGQDYPILVRQVGDRYQVADGETRLRAVKFNAQFYPSLPGGQGMIDAVVRKYDDREMALIAFRTAYHRKELTPLEEARGLKHMIDAFELKHEDLAMMLNKTKQFVKDKMRLLNLPPDVIHVLEKHPNVPAWHAITLGGVKDPEARKHLCELVKHDATAPTVEELRRRKDLSNLVFDSQVLDEKQRKRLSERVVRGEAEFENVSKAIARAEDALAPRIPEDPTAWSILCKVFPKLSDAEQRELAERALAMAKAREGD